MFISNWTRNPIPRQYSFPSPVWRERAVHSSTELLNSVITLERRSARLSRRHHTQLYGKNVLLWVTYSYSFSGIMSVFGNTYEITRLTRKRTPLILHGLSVRVYSSRVALWLRPSPEKPTIYYGISHEMLNNNKNNRTIFVLRCCLSCLYLGVNLCSYLISTLKMNKIPTDKKKSTPIDGDSPTINLN